MKISKVAVPGIIGCGLAGGEPEYVIKEILCDIFGNSKEVELLIVFNNAALYEKYKDLVG